MADSAPESMDELLSVFTFERVLRQDGQGLIVRILGNVKSGSEGVRLPCVVSIERVPFSDEEIAGRLTTQQGYSRLDKIMSNDVFRTARGWLSPSEGGGADVKLTAICPATDKDIAKYSEQSYTLIHETPDLYQSVVEPYIDSVPTSKIQWQVTVYNILDGTAEHEKILYRDKNPEQGFVLAADYKWDQKTMSALYLLAICNDRSIRSLRDIRYDHLHLLRSIRDQSEKAAINEYGIQPGTLRFFIHYQPTYYHFHVHITHISNTGYSGITVGQAHLLDEVIDQLAQDGPRVDPRLPSYWQRRTLTYGLGDQHPLFEGLTAAS